MKNNSLRNLLFVLLAFLLGYGVLYLGDQADSDMQTAIYREMIRVTSRCAPSRFSRRRR